MMKRARPPRIEKFKPNKAETLPILREWFAQEPPIGGVLIYERVFKPHYRMGLLIERPDMVDWLKRFTTMGASQQPDMTWRGAKLIAITSTFEETVTALFPPPKTR